MYIEGVALFLAVSILFYCLFAGADFGAGILELFRGKKYPEEQRELISHAISPVWEANHVWLILAVVILFVGFPKSYSVMSVIFHIPLTIMLIGIILRGCAFTFRQYDIIKDKSQNYYSAFFIISSLVTPLMLGTIAGALFLGRRKESAQTFSDAYIYPWANIFSFSVGMFACVLFTFLAAVYLIGESKDRELRRIFIKRAKFANAIAVLCGVFVFIAAQINGLPLAELFIADWFALSCMIIATFLLVPLWLSIKKNAPQIARFLVAGQVSLILFGWFKLMFPAIIVTRPLNAESITIYNSAAPEVTLTFLLYALVFGSALIFPALIYLLFIFKRTPQVHK